MKSAPPAFLTMIALVLSSATDLPASTPPQDSVLCLPIDFEQWERENPRPAGKRLADLNVGEPRTVRMIYFLPNDRPYREEVVDSIKETIAQVQETYSEQMHAHGFGNLTFGFETDEQGSPLVHRVDGQHPDSNYLDNTFDGIMSEVREVFDIEANNVYLLVIDNTTNLIDRFANGVGEYGGKTRGYVLVPAGFTLKVVAHELGHAFGLDHDFHDDAFIMSYGYNADRLSMCSAAFLSVHSYFNVAIGNEESENSTIELHSPLEYPSGSTTVSVQLEVSDPDGLHQVIFSVDTGDPHPAAGFPEVISCRDMDGETNAVVEFEYNGISPSNGSTSLSNPVLHPISFRAIDTNGNVQAEDFTLKSVSMPSATPRATMEVGGDLVESIAFSPDVTMLASGVWGNLRLWDMETGMEIRSFSLSGSVESVRFSPDGTFIAFVSYRWIKFWNLDGRTEPVTFAETDALRLIAFSPDGTILASVTDSSDPTIKLWNVLTGNEVRTLEGHSDFVWTMAFSPDGSILASRSQDGIVKLWNVSDGQDIVTLDGDVDGTRSLVFSPDGSTLASGYRDGTLSLWEVSSGNRIATISASAVDTRISSYAFSHDGSTLAFGEGYGRIGLWDVVLGVHITAFTGHTEWVRSLAFSPDGSTLASAAYDNTVKLWDMGQLLGPRPKAVEKIAGDNLEGPPNSELDSPLVVEVRDQFGNGLEGVVVTFAVTGGDGKLNGKYTVAEAVTDADGFAKQTLTLGPDPGTNTVEVSVGLDLVTFHAMGVGSPTPPMDVDYRTGHLPDGATGRLGKGAITRNAKALVFSPDGQYLAVAGAIGIWIYDVYTARELALFSGHTSEVTSLAFSPDGATLASGSMDGTAKLWDVASGGIILSIAVDEGRRVSVFSVAFSPDGSMLATGSEAFALLNKFTARYDHRVKLWELGTGRNIATFEGHTNAILSLGFSPDGTTLASGSRDKTAILWDLATGQNIATLRHERVVRTVSFSPDGSTLASGSTDGILKLWDASTGEKIASYRHLDDWLGWEQAVYSIAFSPDGTALAAGLLDRTIRLRDLETGILTTTFEGEHSDAVESVAFSPDGTTLASGSHFKVNLWDVATHNVAALEGHTSSVQSISFSPDGSSLATGYGDGMVRLWDVATKH